jgi:hypothetical protein
MLKITVQSYPSFCGRQCRVIVLFVDHSANLDSLLWMALQFILLSISDNAK